MAQQFAGLSLPFTRISAARGADPQVRAQAACAGFAPLSHGEIGCFESHRRFWAEVVRAKLPGAYVVEDDVVIASDFARLPFAQDLLETVDIIKIDEGVRNRAHYGTRAHDIGPDRSLIRLLGSETSTGSYFVTQRGAQRLLAMSKSYFVPVDRYMFDQESRAFWKLDIWKLDRAAAAQIRLYKPEIEDPADSISAARIRHGDGTPDITLPRQIAFWLRRLRDWDFSKARKARSAAHMTAFAAHEPIETREIPFFTRADDHILTALATLDGDRG